MGLAMKKLKIFFLTLNLLLIGGSTAIMITSLESRYFISTDNVMSNTISPLKGDPDLITTSVQTLPTKPPLSIQDIPESTVEIFYFTDHKMDLRGHGDDTVRFNMKFRSTTERTRFYGYAQLWDGLQTTAISLEAYWNAWVDPNTNTTASFDISGYEIRESGINGPYSVRLRFYKENDTTTTIYDSEFIHTTQTYSYTDFQAKPTIGVTASVIDRDLNGYYEWINVYVSLNNIIIPDSYYLSGTIEGGGVSEDACNTTYLTAGSHTVLLKFAAWDFQGMSGVDIINITNLYIRHDTTPSYQIFSGQPVNYIIGSYASSHFDTPPLELTGNYWEAGYDFDGNGKFNYYRVVVEVNKLRVEDATFYFYVDLYNSTNYYFDETSTNSMKLDSIGLENVTIDFNGILIYKSGIINSNFTVKGFDGYISHRSDIGWNWADRFTLSDEFTTTNTYDYTEFEGPGAYLTHNFNDYGLDTDSDGLFNVVVLEVEVNVLAEGDYYLGGWIEFSSNYDNIAHASTSVHLEQGTQWVSLQYDGISFFLMAVNEVVKIGSFVLEGGTPQTQLDNNNTAILSYYLFTDFDPPKARFTGIYSDTVADVNSDGLWDELKISVEIEFNQTGRYKVHGALKNQLSGQNLEVSIIQEVLAVGTISFVLTFPSDWIWSQHTTTTYLLDNVYIDEVDVYNNYIRQWDYRDDPFTTDTLYNSDEFSPPPVTFTGFFDESLDDLDSDGKSDFIQIKVEIEVTQALPFNIRVMGSLYIDGDSFSNSHYLYDLEVGTHSVNLRWSTIKMYETLTSQPYTVDFYLDRTDNWVRLDSCLDYETTHYAYTQFDAPSAEFTGNIFDSGVDTDIPSNGRFDYIELSFEVNVLEAGQYRIYGCLYADEGGENFYFSTSDGTVSLYPGVQSLTVEVDYYWFLGHSSGCSLYIGYVYLYRYVDTYGDLLIEYNEEDHYLSRSYNHDEFEIPPIALSDNISYDYGVDTDASGTFDYLELVIEVNVTEAGTFYFYGNVYCDSGGNSFNFHSDHMSLGVGLHNISFEIDIAWVRGHEDGSAFYIGEIYLYEYVSAEGKDYQRGFLNTEQYFSRIYHHHDFDPPDVFVARVVEFYPVDFDIDGYYDVYRVVYEVNVTVPSVDLYVYSVLEEYNTGNYITSASTNLYDLTFGLHNVSIDFRGDEIYSSGFTHGLQLSYYELSRSDGKLLDANYTSTPLTFLYIYTDFNPGYFSSIEIYAIAAIEDQFGQVTVNVTIYRYSSELVDMVQVETEYGRFDMSRIYIVGNYEVWTYTYSPSSIDTYQFVVYAYGNQGSEVSKEYPTTGRPEIRSFTMNATLPITVGGVIHFEALVRHPDGIAEVTLHTLGSVFSMDYVESSGLGELWDLEVTFYQEGEYTAFIIVKDVNGVTSRSDSLDIIVNEGSVIENVDISPGTEVNIDEEITFTIEIQKSDAIITSVTLEIIDDRDNDYLIPLEMTRETSTLEIYEGSYTPTRAGTYECTIRVLNTKNQQSKYKVTIEVRTERDITGAPGFELVVALGILVILPLTRKKWNIKK